MTRNEWPNGEGCFSFTVREMFLQVWRHSSENVIACLRLFSSLFYFIVSKFFSIRNFFKKNSSLTPPEQSLLFVPATKVAIRIREKKLKSLELINDYIKHIEKVNPEINAVAYKNYNEAKQKAIEVDKLIEKLDSKELSEYCSTRPLLGVPFSVKDSILIKGKPIASGVYARREFIAEENAKVIERMERAGAILLVTTTVPEYCMWIETASKLYGTTNNPFDLRRNVGGCSGGEAALIGAGAGLIGVGSDYVGSVRQPAFFCGIYGFLPTPELIPNEGHFPKIDGELSKTYKPIMGRIAPLCRYAEDLPVLLEVMSGKPINKSKLLPTKIYFCKGLYEFPFIEPTSQACLQPMYEVLKFFEDAYDLEPREAKFPLAMYIFEFMFVSARQYIYEPLMADVMNDSWSKEQTNCIKELIRFFSGKSDHSLAGILYGLTDDTDRFTKAERERMIRYRDRMKFALHEMLTPNGLLFFPSFPTQATFHNELIFKRMNMTHTIFANICGVPAVQCPMGLDKNGIPKGVMVIGAPNSEGLLIEAATQISKEFGGWKAPGMAGAFEPLK